jgi:hypothetical protein
LAKATPGPWYSDAYCTVFSEPVTREWAKNDGPDYPPYATKRPEGQSYQDWYKLQAAANEADPVVAWTPRLVGDTAVGRHAVDRDLIGDLPTLLRRLLATIDTLRANTDK